MLWQRRLRKARTQPEPTLYVLSPQPDDSQKRQWLKWHHKKERQREPRPLLLCFIWREGRLQTPRSSTKYEIIHKWLTPAAQIWQELVPSEDAARCPPFLKQLGAVCAPPCDWSLHCDCTMGLTDWFNSCRQRDLWNFSFLIPDIQLTRRWNLTLCGGEKNGRKITTRVKL